jgi:hypothetical protein
MNKDYWAKYPWHRDYKTKDRIYEDCESGERRIPPTRKSLEIVVDFLGGANETELARKYRVTTKDIYSICRDTVRDLNLVIEAVNPTHTAVLNAYIDRVPAKEIAMNFKISVERVAKICKARLEEIRLVAMRRLGRGRVSD